MADLRLAAEQVDRFRRALLALTGDEPTRLGVAVSGGPDSLALLLLAAAAFPGRVAAATVDHGLRAESADEARFVGEVCGRLGVPHHVLAPHWGERPRANIQAAARRARYAALGRWASAEARGFILTGHHLDDQAETILMRLARGSGLSGLAGIRATASLDQNDGVRTLRPLLGWRKQELVEIVAAAGLGAVDDPSNASDDYDRTRVRRLLADTPWLAPARIAAAAGHVSDGERALAWSALKLQGERLDVTADGRVSLEAGDLPIELQRRLLLAVLRHYGVAEAVPGPKLARFLDALRSGRPATLAGVSGRPGPVWRFNLAPPRRHP
jgi:tRNA(Ile)-lysidine synthase